MDVSFVQGNQPTICQDGTEIIAERLHFITVSCFKNRMVLVGSYCVLIQTYDITTYVPFPEQEIILPDQKNSTLSYCFHVMPFQWTPMIITIINIKQVQGKIVECEVDLRKTALVPQSQVYFSCLVPNEIYATNMRDWRRHYVPKEMVIHWEFSTYKTYYSNVYEFIFIEIWNICWYMYTCDHTCDAIHLGAQIFRRRHVLPSYQDANWSLRFEPKKLLLSKRLFLLFRFVIFGVSLRDPWLFVAKHHHKQMFQT